MGGTGIIDQFLETFHPIHRFGFGLNSEAKSDISLPRSRRSTSRWPGLFWSWGADEDNPGASRQEDLVRWKSSLS